MTPLSVTVLSSFLLLAGLIWVYRRLAVASTGEPVGAEWWNEFSPNRYQVLGRLLSPEDSAFVRTLPGYRPGLERRLRRQRVAAFRCYLREMRADFRRLLAVGQALVISGQGQPDLREELFRRQVAFTRSLLLVQFQLAAYRLGVGAVDTRGLVESLRGTAVMFQPLAVPAY